MFFAAAAAALAGCGYYGNDEGVRYLQRKDTVTLSAGDASRANAVAQTIHPWPPGVGNRNIPMEGSKAVRAIECYRQGPGQELVSDQRGRTPSQNQQNVGGSGGSGGAGGTAGGGGPPANQLKC